MTNNNRENIVDVWLNFFEETKKKGERPKEYKAEPTPFKDFTFHLEFTLNSDISNPDDMAEILEEVSRNLRKSKTTNGKIYNEENQIIGSYGVD